jgi:murein DD-endopeptidase MepM/ murein hydrolase activator NlpD
MLVLAIKFIKPQILSSVSAPLPHLPRATQLLNIPGIHFFIYRVMQGDTFSSLAQKFNLQEETLRSLNQANDVSEPQADKLLTIPSKNGIFHTVRSGQGLADIARAYEISLGEILKSNQKKGDKDVRPGETLYLPSAAYLSNRDIKWIVLASLSLETKKGFLKPTTGRFADGYGERTHPITGKLAFHEGLDLAPGRGAHVVASQEGEVVFAGIRAGYGRLIILDHGNGLTSWYAHLDKILVKLKTKVKRGELIGKVGNTGRVTGPHLHFEIRLNGVSQNPLLYLVQ